MNSPKKTTFTRSAAGKRRHSSAFDNSTPQALMEVRYDFFFTFFNNLFGSSLLQQAPDDSRKMYEVINNLRTRGAGKPVTLHELHVTTGIDLNRCPSVFASLKVNQKSFL